MTVLSGAHRSIQVEKGELTSSNEFGYCSVGAGVPFQQSVLAEKLHDTASAFKHYNMFSLLASGTLLAHQRPSANAEAVRVLTILTRAKAAR